MERFLFMGMVGRMPHGILARHACLSKRPGTAVASGDRLRR